MIKGTCSADFNTYIIYIYILSHGVRTASSHCTGLRLRLRSRWDLDVGSCRASVSFLMWPWGDSCCHFRVHMWDALPLFHTVFHAEYSVGTCVFFSEMRTRIQKPDVFRLVTGRALQALIKIFTACQDRLQGPNCYGS